MTNNKHTPFDLSERLEDFAASIIILYVKNNSLLLENISQNN